MEKIINSVKYVLIFVFVTSACSLYADDEVEEKSKAVYRLKGIALFSGTDPFSKLIRSVTHSNYSHVGIVLSENDKDSEDEDNWHCFESTGSASEILHKGELPHVRIAPWKKVVKDYKGGVWLRTFRYDEGREPTSEWVTRFVANYNGKPYEKNLLELLDAINGTNKHSDVSSVFCSELAAEMLLESKLLEYGIANNYTPHQFSTEYELPLTGAKLSRETITRQPKQPGCCIIL